MDEVPPCQVALDYLEQNEVRPTRECYPAGSASFYVPARKIKALFEDEPYGLTTGRLFLCPCPRCTRDGGSIEYRSDCFNERRRELELRGDYALIYALLISVRRPGLIQMFQKYELKLHGTTYLRDADFDDLRHRETVLDLETVQRKILEQQYSFLVRTLRPASDIVFIPAKELLPIKEDTELKGEGTFAEVRCFEFQHDDYRSRDFGPHIKRFARKIFRHGMVKDAAKEWYNLQRLSKEEDHPHLMVALGAYWHGSHFFILQEEADRSLHDYLKGPGDVLDSPELWTQMQGVAEGLNTLHKLYKGTTIAYHQDLKPANILIVKGTMKIADFGLLELKPATLPTDTDPTGIPNGHNTGFYAAPRQGKYTRECDIWSLGCIMSEIATCDIQGRDGVSNYKKARTTDGSSGKDTPRFFYGREVKNAVLLRHKQLYASVQTSTPTDGNPTRQLRKKFYNERFFDLLNRMFRQDRVSANLLEVSHEGAGIDAALVVEELATLRKEAFPATILDDGIGNLTLEQCLQDVDTLGPSIKAHLIDFKSMLNRKNRDIFQATAVTDLKQYIVNLQDKQHVERRQQGLGRLGPFLERFGEFGELIATLPSSGEIMGFVWGPVKFLLEATNSDTDAFNDLIDLYGKIGRAQPILSMYKELFIIEPSLTRNLTAAYGDIIHVNKCLVLYFQRHVWKELFATTWKQEKLKTSNIVSRMLSRLELVRDRANSNQFDLFENASTLQEGALAAEIDSKSLSRRQAVYAWMRPTNMENDQEYLRRMRVEYPGTCAWLLEDRAYQEWFDQQSNVAIVPKLLWLNGKPGAGKTVLASLVVEEVRKLDESPTVLFFYFKQEDKDRNNFLSMARTLLSQILEQNPHTLDYFYSNCCSGGIVLTSRPLVEELLSFALRNCESAYIVLDGLDECCTRKERGDITSWFRNLLENGPLDLRGRLHCLFVSQHDSARKDYRDIPSITADADNNEDDIEAFCEVQAGKLIEKLGTPEKYAHEIAKRVSAAAEGVFLFAHLVWINLCGQSSLYGLEREMETFDTDLDKLDKVYTRIMQTIVDKPVAAERDEALMLLGWLVCAKRSLKLHEVQTMRSIDVDNRAVQFERRKFRVDPKDLCESLVDVRADGTIELVHMTARTYLAKSHFLNRIDIELEMATLCIDYLNLPSFQTPSKELVLAGEFGFMEYAIAYWLRHLEGGMSSALPEHDSICQNLTESLEVLINRYWNESTTSSIATFRSNPSRTENLLQQFSRCQSFSQIRLALISTDKELKHFSDVRPEKSALRFRRVVEAVRSCMEAHVLDSPDLEASEALRDRYGCNLFKCSRFSCNYFTDGFETWEQRAKHVELHERPARCIDEHCRSSQIGFATQAQLDRHLKRIHPELTSRQQTFPTDEEIDESMREVSPEPEAVTEHELPNVPTVPDTAVAPVPAVTIDPEEAESPPAQLRETTAKRRRTKQDYRCAHCDKTFNKKFNWESHLQTHGDCQRLPCRQCDKTFARQSDLVRHTKLHDSGNMYRCGGALPNGRRWGCRTDFARQDILRNHHKSKKGRSCIAERDGGEQATASAS